ncbi:ADAMTS-like protein 2 isoform X2 [Betta splendens]|nr:ADAMTS-like protein 2 isoform X2 [Betta splendens]
MAGNGAWALPVCSFLLLQLPVVPLPNLRSAEEEVFQWWGEWSSWSSCSRSCGGGVRSQERHCLIQRLPNTQNANTSYCEGSPKQYQLCPNQPCPSTSLSFKQHQCSQFNSKAFGRRYYQWMPLYPADYISISSKPCDLQCTTTGGERQLLVPAHDGTFCRDAKFQGVCIEGTCQPVGCDGQLYSSQAVDRCGVCGGNGTSCQHISGSYRKALTQLGYVFITNIPAGAKDIQIIERRKAENILALSDEGGHFFFNGNTVFDNPQNFHVAGTVIKYRRPGSVFSDGLEYVMAQGPTLQGLNVMYYNLNGKLPHITYEYILPRGTQGVVAIGDSTDPAHSQLALNNASLTYGKVANHSRGSIGSVHQHSPPLGGPDRTVLHLQEEDLWQIQTASPPPPPAVLVYSARDSPSHVFSHNDVEEQGLAAPPGYRSSSNSVDEPSTADENAVLLSFSGGQGGPSAALPKEPAFLLLEDLQHNHSDSSSRSLTKSNTHTVTGETKAGSLLEMDPDVLAVSDIQHTRADADTHTAAVQAASTESNDFDLGLEPDISVADMYRWKVSAYAPCSSSCTTGFSTSYALCVRYDGAEVDDTYCDSLTRPEPTHEFCSGKECPPRWETSGWSDCSRTCGEGVQYRTVRCWKMLSPGLDSSVYDSLCLTHGLHKPAARKVCHGQSCGPQWEVSDWSECSARCGSRGVRTRDVRCSTEVLPCNRSFQPLLHQECEGPPCDRRWTVSDWGPCSGVCGQGRMQRAVMCRSSGGVVMSEEQCDQSLRPLAIYPCGDRDCAPHWVEQEWQQCNATCGRGVRYRQVLCAGLQSGVFKEFPHSSCDHSRKPEASSQCFQRPCSKWFTTSWSQ